MRRTYLIAAVIAGICGFGAAGARGGELVNWTSAGATSTGTLDTTPGPTNVSLSNLLAGTQNSIAVVPFNLSEPPFAFQPGTTASEMIRYGHGSDWTVTFDQPVVNLLVYCAFWRSGSPLNPPATITTTYEFSQPLLIAPGSSGANPVVTNGQTALPNDTLELTGQAADFFSGILIFPGPVSTLSLDSSASAPGFSVNATFGVVPEPSAAACLALPLAAYLLPRRRDARVRGAW